MTEDQIERLVESRMNSLDNQLMNGSLTQAEYDDETRLLNEWAEARYATADYAGEVRMFLNEVNN